MNSFPLGAAFCFQDWLPLVDAFACKGCEVVCICGCQEPPPKSSWRLGRQVFLHMEAGVWTVRYFPLPKWVGSAVKVWFEFSCGNQA